MTNEQIIAYQRRQRELRASGETIASRLREAASVDAYGAALMTEAADVIDHLHALIQRMNKDARDEQREAQRSAGDAYSEGRHDGIQETRGY